MTKLDKSKISELIEQAVVKMIEKDLNDTQPILSNTGTTVINIEQNNSMYLLLCLHLLNNNDGKNENEKDYDLEALSQNIDILQQKNKAFYNEILEYVNEENKSN